MSKRLLAVIDSTDLDGPYKARARVYRDSEWDEFVVRYYHGDELLSYLGEESDSFHGDQADAMGTAEQQVRALAKQSVPGSRQDNPARQRPKSIDHFRAMAKAHGFKVLKRSDQYYVAEDVDGDLMGVYNGDHPQDAYMMTGHVR